MTSITYVGMDVHTTNYTLCCYSVEDDRPFAQIQLKPEYTEILKYLDRIKNRGVRILVLTAVTKPDVLDIHCIIN